MGLKSFWEEQRRLFTPFVLLLLVIMFIVEFIKGAILVSVLPIYMKSVLGISTFVVGWTMSLQYIGDNVFRSPIGWLIDKVGYRPVMLTGVLLTFTSVAFLSVFSHTGWIMASSALLGIGTSPLWPCVITGATESMGDRANGTSMSVIYMAWLTGVGLGPIVINFFVGTTYMPAFRLLLILASAAVVLVFFMPRRGGVAAQRGALLAELRKRRQSRNRAGNFSNRIASIRRYMSEVKQSLRVRWVFYPALFAQTFALGLLTPILTIYAREILKLTPMQYSFFLLAGGAVTVLFLIPVGKLVDRWGVKWFVNIGLILSSVTLITFTYVKTVSWALLLVAVLGIGYALIIPSWNALIASVIPKEKRGAIWGFFLTIEGSGNVFGPIVSGKMWDTLGYHAPFVTSGIVLAILFVLQMFIFVDRKVMVL